jgi:hypothetical protein
MPIRKMVEQIVESKDPKFFFQKLSLLRANAFEIFYGI